jgi:hypothetical protein
MGIALNTKSIAEVYLPSSTVLQAIQYRRGFHPSSSTDGIGIRIFFAPPGSMMTRVRGFSHIFLSWKKPRGAFKPSVLMSAYVQENMLAAKQAYICDRVSAGVGVKKREKKLGTWSLI